MFDIVIVGGGPAGLSSALILGRSRRSVLVLDSGSPRNAPASHSHGYPSVELRAVAAVSASATSEGFVVALADGSSAPARKIILASGVRDVLPPVPGLAELWGKLVHHCPYCHGWELRDQRIGILGTEHLEMRVPLLRGWSTSLTVLGNGESIAPETREMVHALGATFIEEPVDRFSAAGGGLRVELRGSGALDLDGVFVAARQVIHSPVPRMLGCEMTELGPMKSEALVTDPVSGETSVRGVYAAGDIAGTQQALPLAVASGARVAYVLNHALAVEDAEAATARTATA
jgi:thioredoxin reductase